MNQSKPKLNTIGYRPSSVNTKSTGMGYAKKNQFQHSYQNVLDQQLKKKNQNNSKDTINLNNPINTSQDGNKKTKYINVKNSIDVSAISSIYNEQQQLNQNLLNRNIPTSFKAYLTQNQIQTSNTQSIEQKTMMGINNQTIRSYSNNQNNNLNSQPFFNNANNNSNSYLQNNNDDNSIVVHTGNDSPSPAKIKPSKIFHRQSLNMGANNTTLRQSVETRINHNRLNQSIDRTTYNKNQQQKQNQINGNNNSFNMNIKSQSFQNGQLSSILSNKENPFKNNTVNGIKSSINYMQLNQTVQTPSHNNTLVNVTNLSNKRDESGGSIQEGNKINQNNKVVEDIIDTILFGQTESQQIQNLIEQNKNLLATQQALGAEIQNLTNKVTSYEQEIKKLNETIEKEREESKQKLREKMSEFRNYQQLIQTQTYNQIPMQEELKQLVFNIFEVSFISKSYETKDQSNFMKDQGLFFNLLQAKLKDLMQKINPFVINLNLQQQLTELYQKLYIRIQKEINYFLFKQHGNQIRNELDAHILKQKSSNFLRNSQQLISPKNQILSLKYMHQKKNSSLDTTNNSNSFNFGKDHSRHISAISNSNDYCVKNYLSIESVSGFEKENNLNASNIIPFGQQTFTQQEYEQNDIIQNQLSQYFKEDENNKYQNINNNNNINNQQVQLTSIQNENGQFQQKQQQQFQTFETLSQLQVQNQSQFQSQEQVFNQFIQPIQGQQMFDNTNNNFNKCNKSFNEYNSFQEVNNQQIQTNDKIIKQSIPIQIQQNQQNLQQINISNNTIYSQQFSKKNENETQEFNNNQYPNSMLDIRNQVVSHHSNPPQLNIYQFNQAIQNNKEQQNAYPFNQNGYDQIQNTETQFGKEIELSKLSPCFNNSQENSKRSLSYSNAHFSQKKLNNKIHDKQRMSQILFDSIDKHPNISYDAMRRVKTEADDQYNIEDDGELNYSDHGFYTSKASTNQPQVVAKYDYQGKNNMELSFIKGDLIFVTEKTKKRGWWQGICKNKKGYFPCNFVENCFFD